MVIFRYSPLVLYFLTTHRNTMLSIQLCKTNRHSHLKQHSWNITIYSLVAENENLGKVGTATYLEGWNRTLTPPDARESMFNVAFEWDEGMGIPGALIVKNLHCRQFFLKSLTLEDVPGKGQVHFDCNSWVYPAKYYKYNRVFFSNEASGYIDQMHMN